MHNNVDFVNFQFLLKELGEVQEEQSPVVRFTVKLIVNWI